MGRMSKAKREDEQSKEGRMSKATKGGGAKQRVKRSKAKMEEEQIKYGRRSNEKKEVGANQRRKEEQSKEGGG